MSEVAKLITEIVADASQFKKEIATAKGEATSFTSAIKTGSEVAAIGLTALAGAATLVGKEIFDVAEKVSQLYDNTQKIGLTVAAFQELSVAAKENGVSVDALQNLFENMNKKLGEAQLSGGAAAKALKALGISFNDLKGLTQDQKFELIASQLSKIKDVQLETAVASEIFGKAGKDALALFNSNIEESRAKVRELGLTLTQSQGEALDKLAETKDFIGTIWEGFASNVASEVAPAFQRLLDGIISSVKEMGGLKNAAKDTADYIVAAMNRMENGIRAAINAGQIMKSFYDHVSDSFAGDLLHNAGSRLDQLLSAVTAPARNLIIANSDRPNMGVSRAKTLDANFTDAIQAQKDREKIATTDLTNQVMNAYKDTTKQTAEALKELKDSAMKTATVLDSLHAIKDAFDSPGKTQAKSIISQAVDANRTPLANSTEFQKIFNQTLKDIQQNNLSDVKGEFKQLQGIIDSYKAHFEDWFFSINGKGGSGRSFVPASGDASGLTAALNELKGYLANKTQGKQQTVDVRIKVDASKDFVTTITTNQTFKEAVDAEFDARTAQAARAALP